MSVLPPIKPQSKRTHVSTTHIYFGNIVPSGVALGTSLNLIHWMKFSSSMIGMLPAYAKASARILRAQILKFMIESGYPSILYLAKARTQKF